MGVINASSRDKWMHLLDNEDYMLFAFIDGSWKTNSLWKVLSGVGGLVKWKEGKKIIVFSGFVEASSPFKAEEKVFECLINFIEHNKLKGMKY